MERVENEDRLNGVGRGEVQRTCWPRPAGRCSTDGYAILAPTGSASRSAPQATGTAASATPARGGRPSALLRGEARATRTGRCDTRPHPALDSRAPGG